MPINCKISERVRTFQLVAISDTTTGDDLSPQRRSSCARGWQLARRRPPADTYTGSLPQTMAGLLNRLLLLGAVALSSAASVAPQPDCSWW
jgi:hypothetical protein